MRRKEGAKSTVGRSELRAKFPRFSWLFLLFLMIGAVGSGCGSKPAKPTRIEANVIAARDVNQDAAGRSLPIIVRVYELKTTGSFLSADFYSLYDQEADTLGGDLLAREELNLRPGEQHLVQREASPEAQYLGVIGAFRDIDRANWRATRPLSPAEINKVEISLGANALSIR